VIVIDCSYAMAMVMPDEQRPASLPLVEKSRLVAPPIWVFEVANAFRMAVRRSRLPAEEAARLTRRIDDYAVVVEGADGSVQQRYVAAQNHDLTAYDAAYLDLALQRRCPIATLDGRVAAQARRQGLVVHD
jgi:predicted nucleic acid-binding protein